MTDPSQDSVQTGILESRILETKIKKKKKKKKNGRKLVSHGVKSFSKSLLFMITVQ